MSETSPVKPAKAPPTEFDPTALPPEDTAKWPKVIGIFSLIYTLGGLLCSVGLSVWTVFIGTFMAKMMDADVTLPMGVKVAYLSLGVANLVLGIMMVMGAVALLRRKRQGVKLLTRWAVLRMCLLLVGALLTVVIAPSQIEMQKAIIEAGNRQMIKNGREPNPIPSDEDIHRGLIINSAVFSGIVAIYPIFLGFYLSRRKIKDQIKHWPTR